MSGSTDFVDVSTLLIYHFWIRSHQDLAAMQETYVNCSVTISLYNHGQHRFLSYEIMSCKLMFW